MSPPSPCPDEQQLIEFASGNLAESSHEACAAHISHCERCHSAVEWLRQHPQRCSPEGSSEGSSVGPSVGSSNNHDEAAIDKDAASGPSDRDRIPGPSGSSPESQDGAPFVKPAANIPSRDSNPRDAKAEPQRFAEELAEWKTFLSEEQLQQGVSGKQDGSFPAVIGKLGKYEVLSVIGKGAFGTVFKAYDEQLRRMVALKLLKRSVADHPSARRRFIREARAVAAINHSNVVTIYAVEEIEGLPLLVMELVSGRTLRERIKASPPLKPVEIARIGAQIAAGLAAAHAQGVVHRDVKPSNVLLENGIERAKLTDFGLATCAVDNVELTSVNLAVGTPAYMSPEQATGQPTDARSDLFGLGCVLYSMAAGDSPFTAKTTFETSQRVVNWEPKPLREIRRDIPEKLSSITERLLQKDPAERYGSAAEVADVLNDCLSELHHDDASVSNARPIGSRPARGPRGASTLLIVLAVVLAICLWLFLQNRKSPIDKDRIDNDGASRTTQEIDSPSRDSDKKANAVAPRALEAVVDVVVWGSDQPKRQGRSIREPGVLPIGPGDSLRLDVRLQAAMHLYVVWIDAAGELYPVYPWQPGSWDAGLENPGPVDSISLPEKLDTAWPNKGVGGLETLVLLAAPHPLAELSVRPLPDSSKAAPEPAQPASDAAPSDFDLRKVLAELPKAPKQDARLFFEFDQNGALRLGQDRSPQFAQQQLLEDHVQQTRQFIVERLAPRFALVRVLRFANRGPEEEPDRVDKPPTDSPKSEP